MTSRQDKDMQQLFDQSAYEATDDQLERLLSHAESAPARLRPSSATGRRRWATWAAAAVLLLGVGVAIGWQLGDTNSSSEQVQAVATTEAVKTRTAPAASEKVASTAPSSVAARVAAAGSVTHGQSDEALDSRGSADDDPYYEEELDLYAALFGDSEDDPFSFLDGADDWAAQGGG